MLSENEKFYASELLSALSFEDLKDLSNTVTRRANLPEPVSKEEAIELVVRYEVDVKTLLRRKKLSRTLLCHYLHYKNIPYNVNDDLNSIIKLVIALWSGKIQGTLSNQQKSITGYSTNAVGVLSPASDTVVQSSFATNSVVSESLKPGSVDEMARQFSSWFYGLLNEEFWKHGGEVLGPEHLYGDCSVVLKSLVDNSEESAAGNEAGSRLLRAAVGQVLLQPSSVIAKTEPHGLVAIAVAGTIHKPPDDCVGAFRQAFTLISDPLAGGNWKIKHTELHVASSSESAAIENASPSTAFSIAAPD